MIATLLLATALSVRVQHVPVHQVARPVVVGRDVPGRVDEGSLNMFAYCDARNQPTIMVTNGAPIALDVEWSLTATKPGYPPDHWSSVSRVEPGQFEGWMSPAPLLHLDIRYDESGQPASESIDAFCPAWSGEGSGFDQ